MGNGPCKDGRRFKDEQGVEIRMDGCDYNVMSEMRFPVPIPYSFQGSSTSFLSHSLLCQHFPGRWRHSIVFFFGAGPKGIFLFPRQK